MALGNNEHMALGRRFHRHECKRRVVAPDDDRVLVTRHDPAEDTRCRSHPLSGRLRQDHGVPIGIAVGSAPSPRAVLRVSDHRNADGPHPLMDSTEIRDSETEMRARRAGITCRVDVQHEERGLGAGPLAPGRVDVGLGVRAMRLEVADQHSDQVTIEALRPLNVRDTKLDLDEPGGHRAGMLSVARWGISEDGFDPGATSRGDGREAD